MMVAFSIPVSLLFNSEQEVLGYPMLLVYLFGVWMISIIIALVIVKKYEQFRTVLCGFALSGTFILCCLYGREEKE